MAEYFKIGKIVAVHGLTGQLVLKHSLGKKTSLKNIKAIFFEENKHSFLPWFIETATVKSDEELFIKLEGVDNREAAKKFLRKDSWLTANDFKKLATKSSPISLLGYSIYSNKKILGEILEVIEQPQQLLCRLEIDGKEVLVPLHEKSLEKIDHKGKKVFVNLPDGLLDIYLSN